MRRYLLAGVVVLTLAAAPPASREARPHAILEGHGERLTRLVFSNDGKALATGSERVDQVPGRRRGEIKLWDVATGKLTATLQCERGEYYPMAFSPDGKTLVSMGTAGRRVHWDVAAKRQVRSHPPLHNSASMQHLTF